MARTFLYAIAALIVLLIAGLFALRLAGGSLGEIAFVPSSAFVEQPGLPANAYADPAMWLSHPGLDSARDPARWQPPQAPIAQYDGPAFAVFFVHPTSYLERAAWNAPLDDAQARTRARTFLRGMASPFAAARAIWAPRYRQATFGAFLTDKPEAAQAIDLAYGDVAQAFEHFLGAVGPDTPIVLAGHSQGAAHVVRLLHERVAGTPLQGRIAAAYAVGWPISVAHDLPALGVPACETPEQGGCLLAWASFGEPADPKDLLAQYRASRGFDGAARGDSPILCVNPVSGTIGGATPRAANLGTLRPNADLTSGELVAGAVPARCDARGLLLIGDPPEMGPYGLPGNNYHVYDVPLFWANVRQDVQRRVEAWAAR